jgi:hypothetical protein
MKVILGSICSYFIAVLLYVGAVAFVDRVNNVLEAGLMRSLKRD